ncbi:Probable WRKY transcription factor 23 [Striga hermonthica]|uniref:Probable WRKY transcription factor 23 n=1 Tax=Striga hermonthica TaxID=68872 RepID=A0A9N7RHA1_STRHE|nr:Probable WRKY transcription factor 23 [Striga hermonthica]
MEEKRKMEKMMMDDTSSMYSMYSGMPNSGLLDRDSAGFEEHREMSSLGFLEMSGFEDLMLGDMDRDHLMVALESQQLPVEYSEAAVHTPNNSCSISSSSAELAAANGRHRKRVGGADEEDEEEEEEENQEKTEKEVLKPKKKKQKREKEPRFAFMTKSDVDHLDDGYRWRKYGQKAVKNSPFPRSYYRCTSTQCGVKKRVERSCEDPSIVVTTYEGTHTHTYPITPRGGFPGFSACDSSSRLAMPPQMLQYRLKTQQHYLPSLNISNKSFSSPPPQSVGERRICPSACPSQMRDQGLLQDMLPSEMLTEPKEE